MNAMFIHYPLKKKMFVEQQLYFVVKNFASGITSFFAFFPLYCSHVGDVLNHVFFIGEDGCDDGC